ncbi:MAG: VpsF family polysaccharide biosynthesis protein [Rhodopila sp.]
MRTLRTLAPAPLTDARSVSGNTRLRNTAFKIGLLAVILEFLLSANSLEQMGIKYASVGGNPLFKLHPATYLVGIACLMVLFLTRPAGAGLVRFFRRTPALATYAVLILFCAFYSIVNVGFSGAAVYVESYLSAALLAVALEGGSDRQKRVLAWWIIGFCLLSIVISIGESATQTHLIPVTYGDEVDANTKKLVDDVSDFRGDGLFGHPLTAALTASMATFLLLRMQMNPLLKGSLFTTMLIGLLSFGGRAALVTTVIMIAIAAVVELIRGLARRDLSLGFLGALTAGIVILPPLIIMVIAGTDIGERIITHMYYDDSASVRNTQWLVLTHLNLNDVLFGVPPTRLDVLKYQIGLGTATTDIENFWLLMFLNLGIIGFIVFLFALGLLIVHLGRTANHPLGWMLLVAAILIDSTSNSLGRKSVDLFFMTACVIAMSGYAEPTPVPRSVTQKPPVGRDRTVERLSLRPSSVKLVGFKS